MQTIANLPALIAILSATLLVACAPVAKSTAEPARLLQPADRPQLGFDGFRAPDPF